MARALLIVDFQNDFTPPDGSLAVPGGDAIAGRLNELARSGAYDLVVATRDWHPPDHDSFAAAGGPWPAHCVQNTHGAELNEGLDTNAVDLVIDKGRERGLDGYSAFEDTELGTILRDHGIDEVTVVGLATDYCVRNTALDAIAADFKVVVDAAAVRGVEVTPGDSERALAELRAAGATVLSEPA